MSGGEPGAPAGRLRRAPPPFRRVEVRRVGHPSPRMVRVTLSGAELAGMTVEQPAASVRVLLPSPGASALEVPTWNGNEFLLAGGRRPAIRTVTPLRLDADALELDVDIVLHGEGAASAWAEAAAPGSPAAVSGPGRGYAVVTDAPAYLLGGDETAIPAMSQVLGALPPGLPVRAHIEVAHPDSRQELSLHRGAEVEWSDLPAGSAPGDALVDAIRRADLVADTRIFVAGEAAAVQRIRRHLFDERGIPRAHAWVRGYWKHGRAGGGDEEA